MVFKKIDMNATISMAKTDSFFVVSTSTAYIIGAVIALLIMGYLFYSLVKPEKF
jgi:K+-transporting ATPase KdpF subunit